MQKVKTLAHFVYPGVSNNQRAKLLHNISLFAFIVFFITFQIALRSVSFGRVSILGFAANIPPSQVVDLTNQKRNDAGLQPLSVNAALTAAAKQKGEHMLENNYWAHIAPDGTEPWYFFSNNGYAYKYAGENLARDFSDPASAVNAWMASASHRDNLLSSKYSEIGVAVVEGDLDGVDTTIVVQLFGTKLSDTSSQVPIAFASENETAAQITSIPTQGPTVYPLPTTTPRSTPTPTSFQTGTIASSGQPLSQNTKISAGSSDRVLVSPFAANKGLSFATISVLILVIAIDGVVIARKKIPRKGGRFVAHVAYLVMIVVIIYISRAGKIL